MVDDALTKNVHTSTSTNGRTGRPWCSRRRPAELYTCGLSPNLLEPQDRNSRAWHRRRYQSVFICFHPWLNQSVFICVHPWLNQSVFICVHPWPNRSVFIRVHPWPNRSVFIRVHPWLNSPVLSCLRVAELSVFFSGFSGRPRLSQR